VTVTAIPRQRQSDEALTIKEVLNELKITRSTFYDWRAKRRAPRCYKLPNGELRVRRSALDAWWAAMEEEVA
jgi:predicted DNA-binding transcriptional regulator AlpA